MLANVKVLAEEPLREPVLMVQMALCDVQSQCLDLRPKLSPFSGLEARRESELDVSKLDRQGTLEVENESEVIVEVDSPRLNCWNREVDDSLFVFPHLSKVESESIEVDDDRLGPEVKEVEVYIEGEEAELVHAALWQVEIKVQVGDAIAEQVVSDHVGQVLSHAHFQTRLLSPESAEDVSLFPLDFLSRIEAVVLLTIVLSVFVRALAVVARLVLVCRLVLRI